MNLPELNESTVDDDGSTVRRDGPFCSSSVVVTCQNTDNSVIKQYRIVGTQHRALS